MEEIKILFYIFGFATSLIATGFFIGLGLNLSGFPKKK